MLFHTRQHSSSLRNMLRVAAAAISLSLLAPAAHARVQLKNICTVYGQKETPVVGIGLVVGLNRSGDGGKNAAAMRALASTLRYLNNPVGDIKELSDSANVAMVAISASIPKEGASRGQKIDCYVTSTFGAKSLKGGRLLIAPMRMPNVQDGTVIGLASGPVVIEDEVPTSGRVPGGIVLEEDFRSSFVDRANGYKVTLLLDSAHAGFGVADNAARQINDELRKTFGRYDEPATLAPGGRAQRSSTSEARPVVTRLRDRKTETRRVSFRDDETESLAKEVHLASAVGPDRIEVEVPELYRNDPVGFVSWILDVDVTNPQRDASVVVNTKTKMVVIQGDVQISPVIISHRNLKVEVGTNGTEVAPFAKVNSLSQESPQQLQDLLRGLQELKVSNEDIVSIVRELYHSGNLHGVYIEH